MSIEAMVWALNQRIVKGASPRHVLLTLANYAGRDGSDAFPSVETLAKQTGMSARQVQRNLQLLVKEGAISKGNQEIIRVKGYPANRLPTLYNLHLWMMEKVGCHDVTPENVGVTFDTSRGDICDALGCHDVTQTVIDTSNNLHTTPIVPKPEKPSVEIPDWIPLEAWNGFVEMRKAIKHPLKTEYAVSRLVKSLEKLRDEGHDPEAVLAQSVMCNYRGFFPLRGDNQQRGSDNPFKNGTMKITDPRFDHL